MNKQLKTTVADPPTREGVAQTFAITILVSMALLLACGPHSCMQCLLPLQ